MREETDERRPTQRVLVYARPTKLVLMAALSAGFVVGGLWLLGVFGDTEFIVPGAPIVGVLGIVFFGGCLLYFVFRMLVRKPALVLTPEGLHDHASAAGAGLIRWDEIEAIEPMALPTGQRVLTIHATNPEAVRARQPAGKRMLMGANKGMMGGSVANIPLGTLAIAEDDLLRQIEGLRAKADPGN